MPAAWRLVKTRHLGHALDGEGARLYGGRWNSPGVVMVYASESLALAELEVLVRLQDAQVLPAYSALRLTFPAAVCSGLDVGTLPPDWRADPAPPVLRDIGDAWVAGGTTAVLRVPSAVVPGESNYLLNPNHPDFSKVRAERPARVEFDQRLARRRKP